MYIMTKNSQTVPPPVLLIIKKTNKTNHNHLPLFELTNIKVNIDGELEIGELLTDSEIDDLIEMGFKIKLL